MNGDSVAGGVPAQPTNAREVVIDGERYYAESKLVAALACVYPNSGTLVAHLCDEHLSRSGRLLGVVRDVATETRRKALRETA